MRPFRIAKLCLVWTILASLPVSAATRGQAEYEASCSGCHQPDGLGVPRAYPSLVGTPVIQGDPSVLIRIVLRGRGTMPSMAAELNDEEIAAVLTYSRAAWGNHSSVIDAASVKALR